MHITKLSDDKDYYKDKLKGRVVRRFSRPKMYLLCVIGQNAPEFTLTEGLL